MTKTILDDVPESQRAQILADTADTIEETTYLKPLTEEELDLKRELYFENQIKLTSLQEELATIKDRFKEKTKPLISVNKILLSEVRTKQTEITGTLYHIANHDTGFMETYNEQSELVSTRKLRPNEKQKNLFLTPKTAAE